MDPNNLIEIKWFSNKDEDKNTSLIIRKSVFIDEQKFAIELELDHNDLAEDQKTSNFLIFYNKIPVGTTRLIYKDESDWYVSRLCILKDYRGKKLGNFIMEEIFKKCEELKIDVLYLSAQLYAKDFYQKHGFVEIGDIYYDEHVQHITMWKKLKVSA